MVRQFLCAPEIFAVFWKYVDENCDLCKLFSSVMQ
jgi:hypothetical protein